MTKLYTLRDAAQVLGISYSGLKQWIYQGKLKSIQTTGGHHRIPEAEVDRFLPRIISSGSVEKRRRTFRRISGRNQLIGRVTDIKISGLLAQVTLSIDEQHITSIITADAVRELRLKKGQIAAALIKSTEVMIVLPNWNRLTLAVQIRLNRLIMVGRGLYFGGSAPVSGTMRWYPSPAIMELAVLCPHCGDMKIEPVSNARLFAEHLPGQTTTIAGSVFHCRRCHIFATLTPLDPSRRTE